ncbi:uncharacterized protein LOC113311488 [Papaver somniferum]|uniref:uncharacterized protein LOC113311488 n=1 Tax=Papaver somniferum TaxID=3469 RepID=UPI000E6FEC1B|nr:uncharacterized protein LOC113311488 [Papaver somniferum]
MAYIPPHKRHSKDDNNIPLPTQFQKKVGSSSSSTSKSTTKRTKDRAAKLMGRHIIYLHCSISKWFIEADDDQISADSIRLEPFVGYKSVEWERGGKPFILVCDSLTDSGSGFPKNNTPWVSITDNIRSDLLASFENMRTTIDLGEAGVAMKTTFVARFGTVLFHKPSVNISSSSSKSEAATTLARVRKQFCTKVTDSYIETIFGGVFPMIVADPYQPKEYYRVQVSDKVEPESATKRDLTAALKDEELKGLKQLVDSAILDGNVKGGLRWPMGKEHSFDGRYSVVGAWHSIVKTFKNASLKLKFINADRFDFCTSDGEIGKELTPDMKGVNDMLMDRLVDMEPAIGSLEDNLKLVWNHLLSF